MPLTSVAILDPRGKDKENCLDLKSLTCRDNANKLLLLDFLLMRKKINPFAFSPLQTGLLFLAAKYNMQLHEFC